MGRRLLAVTAAASFVMFGAVVAVAAQSSAGSRAIPASPITHVVVIDLENHSFDNVLGKLCVLDARCDGVTTGITYGGTVIDLPPAEDVVPRAAHTHDAQVIAMNGGAMNGFNKLQGCGKKAAFACFQQFDPSQIPNLAALARAFVISDRTFELDLSSSWGSHLELVTGDLNGFTGNNPTDGTVDLPGVGCDRTDMQAEWVPPGTTDPILVPACVPFPDGTTGAGTTTPVPWIPTIMDALDQAGLSWRIYQGEGVHGSTGYGWPICPTFADCIFTPQIENSFSAAQVIADAGAGALPALSLVTPLPKLSEHNKRSMLKGDNWLWQVVSALEQGPDWLSTAIFITYDDCGCFYDHVSPPQGLGIRLPMVIVSPWAKPGYTDSNDASFASILAFVERVFSLPPLGPADAAAYDFWGSFAFGQTPLDPVPLRPHPVPTWELRWLARQPDTADDAT